VADDRPAKGSRAGRIGWTAFYAGLFVLVALLIVFAVAPGYMSPNSRSWSSANGYPAIRRMLGLAIPVPIAKVSMHELRRVVSSEGTLQYLNEVPVNVDTVGVLTALHVEPGSTTKRGDILATVDTGGFAVRESAANVEQKNATYQTNKRDYERQKDAYKRGLVAQAAYELSEKNYLVAAGQLQQAREGLAKSMISLSQKVFGGETDDPTAHPDGEEPLRILAPISGKVSKVGAYVGETLVRPGETIVTIGDKLLFRTTVDQRDFERIKVGDKADIRLQALAGRTVRASVTRIDPIVASNVDQQRTGQPQGTFYAWLTIDDPKIDATKLMPGMTGYSVAAQSYRSLAVPESALLRFSGGEGTVLAVNASNRIEVVPVQYSVDEHGWVGIASGLPEGAIVVLNGQIGLRAGDLVEPR
jgi:multidrug efflux pump subunit AcrA (membrane-fusion protein)